MSWPNWADEWPVTPSTLRVVLFWHRVDAASESGNVAFTASGGWTMDQVLSRAVRALSKDQRILPWFNERAVTGLQYLDASDKIRRERWKDVHCSPVSEFCHSTNLAIIRLDFQASRLKFTRGVRGNVFFFFGFWRGGTVV